jgi:hypothetical protein
VLVTEQRDHATVYHDVRVIRSLDELAWMDPSVEFVAFLGLGVTPVSRDWLGHMVFAIGEHAAATGPLLEASGPSVSPIRVSARGFNLTATESRSQLWPIAKGTSPTDAVDHDAEVPPGEFMLIRRSILENAWHTLELGEVLEPALLPAYVGSTTRVVAAAMAMVEQLPDSEPPDLIPRTHAHRTIGSKLDPGPLPPGWSWVISDDLIDPSMSVVAIHGNGFDFHASTGAVSLHTQPEKLDHANIDEFDAILVDQSSAEWEDLLARPIEREGRPSLGDIAAREASRPTVSIRIAPPDRQVAPRWGDTHFAQQFGAALVRRGFRVSLSTVDEWWHPQNRDVDIVIHLRGLAALTPHPRALNVVWLISHPDDVSPTELEQHDLVLVASLAHAHRLEAELQVPVVPFLQATNPRRFHPLDITPNDELVFVGNSRGVYRTAVHWAIEQELPIRITGHGWDGILPSGITAEPFVPNNLLNEVFNSGAIVLADHWPDMARLGFVSNRVFDAAASGTFVLSDRLPGLDEVFGSSVAEFNSADELRALAETYLGNPIERNRHAADARQIVLEKHTFDHRSEAFVTVLTDRLGWSGASALVGEEPIDN